MFNFNPYGQPMQSPFMSPMQPQPMQAQQPMQPSGLNRVTGADGARAFTMPPNAVAALFDDTRDVFYIKTTDSGGFPTIKAYRFTALEEEPHAAPAQAMTREDIQQLVKEEIDRYAKQFVFTATTAPADAEYVATAKPVYADHAG